MTRRELLIVLLGAMLAFAGCDRSEPPKAPDAQQTAPQKRVVVLSPALAGTLRWLGAEKAIVGRHGYDGWSDQALPVCGDQAGFDYETLLRVNPTHILIEWGDRPLPERMTTLAKERGWTIKNYSTLTLDDVARTTDDLAALLAQKDLKPSERLRTAWSKRDGADLSVVGRVLLLVSSSPPTALGPGSAHQQILLGLGGRAALEKGGPYQTLDAEDVLKIAPDAIVLIVPRTPGAPAEAVTPDRVKELLGPLAGLPLKAVSTGRVAVLDDPEGQLPGAALVKFADALHAKLVAWAASPLPGAP